MRPAQLTNMNVSGYTGNFNRNFEILKNGGAVRITTKSGSGKWSSYYTCKYPSSIAGLDLVMCNDAPRGGKLGNYIAATKQGDKTFERAQFVRNFRRAWRQKMLLIEANKPEAIRDEVLRRVDIIADMPAPEGDSRYYINGYHGCGVYRIAIQKGKIVATLYGGYHDSAPYGVEKQKWYDAVHAYLVERLGANDSGRGWRFVKADGSGCQFFLRNEEDAHLIETKQYIVPAPNGDGNLGFAHHNVQIA